MASSTTGPAAGAQDDPGTWKASPESKARAKKLRIIAVSLWVLGLVIELVGIFGLLLNDSILVETTSVDDRGVLQVGTSFPTWAFVVLIVLLILDGVAVAIGSILWKRANTLDPASSKDTVRFFVQNQLGAFIPIIAFLPIIILIFLNKEMGKGQKGAAGAVAIVVALVASVIGIDFNPSSIEKYTVEKQAVVQLLGSDTVYWSAGGGVYHVCGDVPDLAGSTVTSGTTADAVAADKPRLTLRIESELKACGRAVPNNIDEIVAAIREVQDGSSTDQVLPAPDWTGVGGAPSSDEIDTLEDALQNAS